jgi:tRNA(fMet)-specific endonuclease VapC
MSGTYLLDTNAVVALLNGDAAIETVLDNIEDAYVPSVVLGELYFGAALLNEYFSGKLEA